MMENYVQTCVFFRNIIPHKHPQILKKIHKVFRFNTISTYTDGWSIEARKMNLDQRFYEKETHGQNDINIMTFLSAELCSFIDTSVWEEPIAIICLLPALMP